MTLTTRCPHCGTAFQVAPDQLKIRDGLVRCGVCTSVFDGCATLVAEIPTLRTASPWAPTGISESAAPPEVLRGRHHALRRPDLVVPCAADNAQRNGGYVDANTGYAPSGHGLTDPAPDTVHGEARMRYVDDYHTGCAPPEFLDHGRAQQRAHWDRLWGWGCLVAAVVLLGLSLYVYRVQWATRMPALRPVLQSMCVPLQCNVGYERRIERISILSSSLRPSAGGASALGQQQLVLTAVLRNRFNASQHWPALILELKDFSDTLKVRKTLMPHDYLPAEVRTQPFGPNAERKIVLPLHVHDVQVNGYQLNRFFP
jgi:predicted Zn finger-like uncharacterized protein